MRAALLTEVGRLPEVVDVTLAPPGPGEVLVDIAAAGVCHSDLHVLRGDWPLSVPLVMGHEGAGVVSSVGEGVETLSPGDHVVLSWYAPCGACARCRLGRETQCLTNGRVVAAGGVLFDGTSRLSRDGATVHHYLGVSSFAEQAVVPATGAIAVRRDAPLDLAALVGCAVATGVGAVIHAAKVEPGATVVVIGTGGVGLSVVQGARVAGAARIVAVDLLASKLAAASRLGATDVVDASAGNAADAVLALLPDGADYAFDAIGHPSTTEQAISLLGPGGAAVVVGLPAAGARASFEPLSLAEADQRIIGTNYGSVRPSRDIPQLVDWAMAGQLDLEGLVSARRPLAEAADALVDLQEGRALRQLLVP
ncbi:MAG: Zn-dependent alcohol dehydrogenase [Actinomycetota bacterium]|nr:Zn-dependent alcohol dehydrogenase [Actinomycetota bacterium]MDH5277479.1 Zn-dependent alcohol dehydrogenase [Actinomycetota bacterium]